MNDFYKSRSQVEDGHRVISSGTSGLHERASSAENVEFNLLHLYDSRHGNLKRKMVKNCSEKSHGPTASHNRLH